MDSRISEYEEALEWLFSQLPMFSRVGAAAYKPGLDNTLALDDLYGHPHRRFRAIHVAGTNGKGSTSHMIAAALQAHGFKTGLYTSPHLTDFRERMRINGDMIPREEVMAFVKDWRNRNSGLRPSFFELTMMMAFDWFAREKVDYAVIEVGMGGRLDSTNIITPILSVITNISYDHTQFLGTTLPAIAAEKAGIIKPGVPVVIGEAEGEVKDVFTAKAKKMGAPVVFASDFRGIEALERIEDGWKVTLKDDSGSPIRIPLGGEYQKKNIRTAICSIYEMRNEGINIAPEEIREGLENVGKITGLRGRWQKVADRPTVICDTGHNVAGLTDSMKSLESRYPGRRLHFVIGFVNDKDVSHIVSLFPGEGRYYFTKAQIPRAMEEGEVASRFAARGIQGEKYPTVKEAFAVARKAASPEDVIYVGGSTFIVADFLKD